VEGNTAHDRLERPNADLHGNAPDTANVALLIIDMINGFDFVDGKALWQQAMAIARPIASLKQQAKQAGIPVIYVNDNFGKWRSDFRHLVHQMRQDYSRGKTIVQLLLPEEDDYFVLKPKHSGFFSTPLDLLLAYLQVKTLILTGIQSNICVLFTANDAYMRDFRLVIPADCVASSNPAENKHTLAQMHRVLKADIRSSGALDLVRLNSSP
jgi:nicotinamidase-related amidase